MWPGRTKSRVVSNVGALTAVQEMAVRVRDNATAANVVIIDELSATDPLTQLKAAVQSVRHRRLRKSSLPVRWRQARPRTPFILTAG